MLVRVLGSLSLLTLVGLTAVGCAADAEEEDAESEGAVTVSNIANARVTEQSRFRREGRLDAKNDGRTVGSWRVNGFGGTKVRIEVKPKSGGFAPLVALAGPIPGDEGKIVVAKRGTKARGVVLETSLEARGAYRILVGTQASFEGRSGEAGDFEISYRCVSGCELPELSLSEVVTDLQRTVGQQQLKGAIDGLVTSRVPEGEGRTALLASVGALLENPRAIEENGLPVVPIRMGSIAQGFIEPGAPSATPAAPKTFELGKIGESCQPHRSDPAAAREILPGLTRADVPDYSYDDCSLAKLEGLADAFNALAMQNGSAVVDGDARYTTVSDLASALLAKGHRIVLDNARYYADFLGLNYKGKSVRAPVYVDTGIPLTGGGTLRTPAPHAHHNIWIRGPQFDGQLMFYMGTDSGTAFRVKKSIGRAWSGERVTYEIDSATKSADVVRVLGVAGDLRKKWQTAGANLPLQGYGKLGVCTDSSAILEHAYRGSVTLYPLANPETGANADAIDRILASMPNDIGATPAPDAVTRLGASIPFDDVSKVPFPAFTRGWAKVAR